MEKKYEEKVAEITALRSELEKVRPPPLTNDERIKSRPSDEVSEKKSVIRDFWNRNKRAEDGGAGGNRLFNAEDMVNIAEKANKLSTLENSHLTN